MSNKIKEWRTLLQLSQSEFGKLLCGIPQRTIQSWELGERTPPKWVLGLTNTTR
ncbi:helix-turn-helix transcriptional regulator [Anaerovibrio sp.]|uniref:helix-turn-helix domain-containing protein n=1 Tax=Anaerovibrio sp. TaxID=1872532 RepID=UPI00344F63D3|nr:helix-turn-helix transcriptional regulator [Anaerovibrio sp.]